MCLVGFDGSPPANLDRIWRLLLDQVNSKIYKRGGEITGKCLRMV